MPVFTFENEEAPAAADFDSAPAAEVMDQDLNDLSPQRLSRPMWRTNSGLGIGLMNNGASTPPIRIASQSPARGNGFSELEAEDVPIPPLNFEEVKKKAAKRKKRKGGMKPPAPAAQIVRGFETPCHSGDEDSGSAATTPRMRPVRDFPSVTSSPAMRPCASSSGISSLRMQLDALSMGDCTPTTTTSPPMLKRAYSMQREFSHGSETANSDRSETDTYEVPLESDFVSPDANGKSGIFGAIEGGLRHDSIVRKMTADDFEPLTCLGKGAFGTVLLVKQRATGRLYAQKQFKKASLTVHKRLVEQTKTERSILESVNRHPFVVKLFYAFQDHEKLYLILEYGQGGELFHHLAMERMFSPETTAFYMAELVLALEHLHTNLGVIYRDLKPENCLLDAEGHLLLTDFGLSKVALDEDKANSFLGTVEYMAPEVVAGEEYGRAVDWWALGALGFDMLTGNPPFTGQNNKKIQDKIRACKITFPFFLGPDAKDLLTRLLRKNPRQRLGYNMPKDLDIIKKHRFFKGIDWKKLARREVEPPIRPLITDPELAENFSNEFTDLALSPVDGGRFSWRDVKAGPGEGTLVAHGVSANDIAGSNDEVMVDRDTGNPFGGFSFVASESLLEGSVF